MFSPFADYAIILEEKECSVHLSSSITYMGSPSCRVLSRGAVVHPKEGTITYEQDG
jgi:hypothetical protein